MVLFSEAKIGSLGLANRMIRTASHEGLAESRGRPTDKQFAFYKRWKLPSNRTGRILSRHYVREVIF